MKAEEALLVVQFSFGDNKDMESEPNPVPIEPVVGGLVWVRRRNGSWWPGRIMGLHELPQSCLLSPRSGTPVKLLGREDASLDWYNLEKSRRVKAFRCGEYDECIEKAKASAAGCNKRAVKYARREDAILHALELEGAQKSDGNHTSHPRMDGSSGKKHEDRDKKVSSPETNPTKDMSQSGISFEDPDHVSTSTKHSLQKKKRKTPNDSEDDGTEGTKRMRGLEDLGVGVSPKKKSSMYINSEGSHELVHMSRALHESSNSLASAVTRSKTPGSLLKIRQSQVAILHENMKRKNRRRQLTKVLESTVMVSVPVLCEQDACPSQSSLQGATNSKISALESKDSKKTSTSVVVNNKSNCNGASCDKDTSLDASEHTCDARNIRSTPKATDFDTIREFPLNGCSDSDGLFDVPFVVDAKVTRGLSPAIISSASRQQSSEELDESGSTNVTVDVNSESQRIVKRTSKWQLKGKRNFRSHNQKTNKCLDWRRSLDKNAGPDISLAGKHHVNGYSGGLNGKVESNTMVESLASDSYVHWGDRTSEPTCLDTVSYGKQSSKKREHEKSAVTKDLYLRDGFVSPPVPQKSLPYRLSRFTPHPKYQDVEDVPNRSVFASSLFDVNLEVRAGYSGQHVPLVSLMSKLNGKAIVGHPVTVEVWDDGYCDVLFTSIDCCPTSSSGDRYDVSKDKHAGGSQNGSIIKSSPVNNLRVQSSPKKSPKTKKSSILSKKTRRLSSFTIALEGAEEDHKLAVAKSVGSVLSCIPLKVVFSRLNEALNGSKRPAVDHNLTSTKP